MKKCTKCKEIKYLTSFYNSKFSSDKLRSECILCEADRSKKYRINNRLKLLEYKKKYRQEFGTSIQSGVLKTRYGITIQQYKYLLFKQRGKCKICPLKQKDMKIALAVDHDHISNRIRGLLCSNCNRGIGFFQDNPKLLRKAARYLKKPCREG